MKVATTVRTGKMTAANDRPIAIAPIPIWRALTHAGDFTSIILFLRVIIDDYAIYYI